MKNILLIEPFHDGCDLTSIYSGNKTMLLGKIDDIVDKIHSLVITNDNLLVYQHTDILINPTFIGRAYCDSLKSKGIDFKKTNSVKESEFKI